ncbi:hypothetical protein ACIBL6_41135 [Streptomyces sp. NPDC050400]|uniref:hypothetical protein n=1 Tax=Streptomyces sp. NPDC050400 TaxID=3365610 RepID=UPI0037A604F4
MSAAPAARIDVLTALDWQRFADEYWDRRPVLIRGLAPADAPFDPNEVFESAVVAAQRPPARERIRLTVGTRLLTDPGDLLPGPEDGTFSGYDRRTLRQLADDPFALVVRDLHAGHHPLWVRERDFLAGLWDRVGQPLAGVSTTLHHGTCEPVPEPEPTPSADGAPAYGATFLYTVRGQRGLRLDSGGPGRRTSVETVPGDLLYRPPGFRHSVEPHTVAPRTAPASVVRIGIPRSPLRPGAELHSLLAPGPNPVSPQAGWGGDDILVPDGDGRSRDLSGTLPPVLAAALDHFKQAARPAALERRVAREALRQATDGGLRPVPPPARPGYFTDDDAVRATERVLWAEVGGRRLVAACGHVLETDLSAPELSSVIGLLNAGHPVQVGELAPPARTLMSRLAGFRSVERL